MTSAPALVILRGNSASGKSTIARKVQHDLPRGRIAVIGQDPVRREVLWEENDNP
ncbi:zeta toxin family protein, partial [Luteolibacter marinus]